MLFSIILRAKGLKGIVSAVKTSYEEAVLRINEDGVHPSVEQASSSLVCSSSFSFVATTRLTMVN